MLAALAALHMCSARSPLPAASTRAALAATCVCALRTHSARAAGVGWLYVLLLMHQSGIARASDVLEQSESIADILSNTHTAVFLVGMHGMVHTDEIGMHTVLYSLQRAPRRDARQPCPARPAHLLPQRRARPPKRPGAPRAAVAVERPGGVVPRARHTP